LSSHLTDDDAEGPDVAALVYGLAFGLLRGHNTRRPARRLGVRRKALFVYRTGELAAKVMRLDYDTGRRELVREIPPADRAGVSASFEISTTPDGNAYACGPAT
jgi:hypothetical protein